VVSIIIVAMGIDKELTRCLDSIRIHVRTDLEIIIVNNSKEPLGATLADKIIENGRNLGFARAVNRGIKAAEGELILLLNPDTRFDSDVISPAVHFMNDNEKAGICGIQLIFPDSGLQNSFDNIPNLANQFINKSMLKILFPKAYPGKRSKYAGPVEVSSVIGAFMMLRRSMLEKIGLLDEGYFFYLEETDLCKRAKDSGFEVWHLPRLKLVHYQGVSARKSDIPRTIEYIRSMHRFFLKHEGESKADVYIILTMIKSFIEVLTNLPLCFMDKTRKRMIRSASVFLWLISAMPRDFGLEKIKPAYSDKRQLGYKWFIPQGVKIPDKNPDDILESLPRLLNRSKTTFVKSGDFEGGQIFLKRYNYKGIKDSFKNLFRKSRGLKAMEAALMLESTGLNTPGVIFACEKRVLGILVKSFIATYAVDARNLVEVVSGKSCPERLTVDISAYIRRMHETGVFHVDLKGENLLYDGNGNIYLVDLDRLKFIRFLKPNNIIKNLSYLNASFCMAVGREKRIEFLDEYLKGNPGLIKLRDGIISGIEAYTSNRLKKRYM
jgi:GT2 family glycosyltransferase/tRNA A-37 threonylcarbamoyl transferase component Bud32